tara:strand:+ start:448 stop:996 length:549 start_codon:yes stop_codon:yes gene_type:complete
MSTCDITSGFTLGCRDNTGGIRNIYILSGSVVSVSGSGDVGLITEISGSGTFYKFELTRQTGDYVETINGSTENGTVFFDQTVNASFHKMQSATRNQIRLLAKNVTLKMIVETNNGSVDGVGKFFYLGEQNGLSLNAGQGQSGTAFGDANAYQLTFNGQEPDPASPISGSDLTPILQGIALG